MVLYREKVTKKQQGLWAVCIASEEILNRTNGMMTNKANFLYLKTGSTNG